MKVLVTGAGGYIGSVATYLLLQNGYEVVALDNFSTGYQAPLELLQEKFGKEKIRYYKADITEEVSEVLEKEKDISAVFHYAALCLVDESMKEPGKYFTNNIGGTLNLLLAMSKFGIPNLIFSSTCAVYGGAQYVPIDEKHPLNPDSPYGESKAIVEKIIHWYGELKGLHYIILRYFNVCGASDDGLMGDSKKPSVLLVQNAVRGALGIKPFYFTYQEVDTPDASPIRDYINVMDLNEAHLKALEYLSSGGQSETLNLGTGTGNSVLEIVEKVETATKTKINKNKSTPRQGESSKLFASIEKAKKILHWEPKRSIEDSVRSLVDWYKNHPNGWDK